MPPVPAAPARLEPVEGPVSVRLYDTERNNALALRQEFRVAVAEPREYVRVAGVRFDPPGPATGGKNRLEVTLQAAATLSAPPCVARLAVPADEPAAGKPPSGTRSGELPPPDEALKLFAEQMPAPPGGEGPARWTWTASSAPSSTASATPTAAARWCRARTATWPCACGRRPTPSPAG